jgi:regulator of protease activity HflC (stomatin/prohibitin superfamily)
MVLFFEQVRPTERALIERFGKFARYEPTGLVLYYPIIERCRKVNITEKMVACPRQEVITEDNLNAAVSAQVYYKIKDDEQNVKNSQYNVNHVERQIVSLAQTTLRNTLGSFSLNGANKNRADINKKLQETITQETLNWGIDIVRCEIAEIEPPENVQKAMNNIVIAQSEKQAATDFATAVETKADGTRRAAIKEAEGRAKSLTVEADAKAEAIRTVNKAASETFTGAAVDLKKLEVAETIFKNNSKIIIPQGSDVTTFISDLVGTGPIPIPVKK